jgi:hypothetical protein
MNLTYRQKTFYTNFKHFALGVFSTGLLNLGEKWKIWAYSGRAFKFGRKNTGRLSTRRFLIHF